MPTKNTFYSLTAFWIALFLIIVTHGEAKSSFEEEQLKSDENTETFVEKEDQISDFDARLELVKVIINQSALQDEVQHHIAILLEEKPEDLTVYILETKFLLLAKKYCEVNAHIQKLLNISSLTSKQLASVSLLEAEIGHFVSAQNLFHLAFQKIDTQSLSCTQTFNPSDARHQDCMLCHPSAIALYLDSCCDVILDEEFEQLVLDYATIIQQWGDYQTAELIYQNYFLMHPESIFIHQRLAAVYARAQRFEEAEQHYLQSLILQFSSEAALSLGRLYLVEKKYDQFLNLMDTLEESKKIKNTLDLLILKAEGFNKMQRYEEAATFYISAFTMVTNQRQKADFLALAAKSYWQLGDVAQASVLICYAYALHADSAVVQYYYTAFESDSEDIENAILINENSAQELYEWANLYAENSEVSTSILFFQTALNLDPEFIPASIGLANAYSLQFLYHKTESIYEDLLNLFPCSDEYLLQRARIIGWQKNYLASIQAYDVLIKKYPEDPVPVKEKARVALWGHLDRVAWQSYASLLDPSTEELYFEELNDCACFLDELTDEKLAFDYEELVDQYQCLDILDSSISPEKKACILSLYGNYWIQKTICLEMQAKKAAWNNLYLLSTCYYAELLSIQPGNEEAWFDFAQVFCSLGLKDNAKVVYGHMHAIDPYHNLVSMAIKRMDILECPKLVSYYTIWSETGRGGLSSITRQKFGEGLEYSFDAQTHARISASMYVDHPFIESRHLTFYAATLDYDKVFNEKANIALSASAKIEGNYDLTTHYLGQARFQYRFCDQLLGSFFYERSDEFYNLFGITQGVQSDAFGCKMAYDFNRKNLWESSYKYLRYTDQNHLHMATLGTRYQLTEHPKNLNFFLEGEYRNTAHLDIFIYDGSQIVDIIHPYWTPQNYFAGRTGFEWQHQYSDWDFCGSEKRYYSLRVGAIDDTENNLGGFGTVEWHHEWNEKWIFNASAFLEVSRQWRGGGVWVNLGVHF